MHHPLHVSEDLMYCVCVIAVGGLTSPVKGPYTEPLYITNKPPDSLQLINSSFNYENEDDHQESVKVITTGRRTEKLDDDDDDGDEDKRAGCNESKRDSLFCPQTLISEPNHKRGNKITTVPELELRKLERGEVSLNVLLLLSFLC